jgi:hypothetical protein
MKITNAATMISELRSKGYRVMVRHVRHLKRPIFNPELKDLDDCLTRSEFKRYTVPELQDQNTVTLDGLKFGDVVDPCGGFTEVILVTPSGEQHVGKCNFAKTRPFNRRNGLTGALGRALS